GLLGAGRGRGGSVSARADGRALLRERARELLDEARKYGYRREDLITLIEELAWTSAPPPCPRARSWPPRWSRRRWRCVTGCPTRWPSTGGPAWSPTTRRPSPSTCS